MQLGQVAQCESLPLRRALYWRFLAETILYHKDDLVILRYEDTVISPGAAIQKIFQSSEYRTRKPDLPDYETSSSRSKREHLTKEDVLAIKSLCVDIALELGYEEDQLMV